MALPAQLLAASTLAIVLGALGVVVLLLFVGGLFGVRARDRRRAGAYAEHVAEADHALEQARAADRGWERGAMEAAARAAVEEARPGWPYQDIYLVLVDDRPGVEEDRAHFVAVGPDGEARIVLGRREERWVSESVQ